MKKLLIIIVLATLAGCAETCNDYQLIYECSERGGKNCGETYKQYYEVCMIDTKGD